VFALEVAPLTSPKERCLIKSAPRPPLTENSTENEIRKKEREKKADNPVPD
jgi:hypothetical protein